jgi:hypothetical protein
MISCSDRSKKCIAARTQALSLEKDDCDGWLLWIEKEELLWSKTRLCIDQRELALPVTDARYWLEFSQSCQTFQSRVLTQEPMWIVACVLLL